MKAPAELKNLALAGITIFAIFMFPFSYTKCFAKVNNKSLPQFLLPSERNTIQIFHQAGPLVVFVHNLKYQSDIFSFQSRQVQSGAGSGFIWDNKGHIVTNFHVIANADKIRITLKDGTNYKAKFVGAEPRKDIAVLKINLKKFNHKTFNQKIADSNQVLVGQKTIAIGNPFGLDQTLTSGIISAVGRSVPSVGGVTIRDMLQTDASINPGNSGGPLLDSRGFLLGMNTMIFSKTGSSAGIGFAVPSNTIKRMVNQIIKYGKVIQPGIGFTPLNPQISDYFGISGVVIGEIKKSSPAYKAGLRGTFRDQNGYLNLGDVIVSVDGEKVRNYDDLYNVLESRRVGQRVKIGILRKGKKKTVETKLINLP